MGEFRNAYKISVIKPEGHRVRYLATDGWIILK
jgi:hypothetical protein